MANLIITPGNAGSQPTLNAYRQIQSIISNDRNIIENKRPSTTHLSVQTQYSGECDTIRNYILESEVGAGSKTVAKTLCVMTEISEQLITELSEEILPTHPVRARYDPQNKYRGIIDEVSKILKSKDLKFIRYEGGYLELKAELWQREPDIDQQWVSYIP